MKRVLLTGQSGFIGRNLVSPFSQRFELLRPARSELDLLDSDGLLDYVIRNRIDVIFHSANPNPVKNPLDSSATFLSDSLRTFANVYRCRSDCEKIVYLGSGAEYDKRFDIRKVTEEELGKSIPVDPYGLSKYFMNEIARCSKNVFNMRLFACFGPTDHESKFITHAINCCLGNVPITIRQDCWFDYLHVDDFVRIACWFVESEPIWHDYNVCSGQSIRLVEIAEHVRDQTRRPVPIEVMIEGMNREYTSSNVRLASEMQFEPSDIFTGIAKQIEWQRGYQN